VDFPDDNILDLFNTYYFLNEGLTPFQNLTESLALKALSSFSSFFLEKISSDNKVDRLAWKREHYQRNMIMDGLNCNPDDVVIISDLDEIPNPQKY
jgi:beta-1,4-mannosyl-glycoprotein beta-1,4-N-acetylglucosaminyltransferase